VTLPLDPDDKFQATMNRVLGDRIRKDDKLACVLWCALANVDWRHKDGDTAGYSFRAAGELVAAIRGSGHYMDWYMCGRCGQVDDEVADALAAEGWTYELM
jgi:hypothetical protein